MNQLTAIAIGLVAGYFLGSWITYCTFHKAILNHNQRVGGRHE